MNVSEISGVEISLAIGLGLALVLGVIAWIRSNRRLQELRAELKSALADSETRAESQRSLMATRIVELEKTRDINQVYIDKLEGVIGRRLENATPDELDRLYVAIDVKMLELARTIWQGDFPAQIRKKLEAALLVHVGQLAADIDPKVREIVDKQLEAEAANFVVTWLRKDYSKLTGHAKTFADKVWAHIGDRAANLPVEVRAVIDQNLIAEAAHYTTAWIHQDYNKQTGIGKTYQEAIANEIQRQGREMNDSLRRAILEKLIVEAAHFTTVWLHQTYDKLTGCSKAFADAVWNHIGAQAKSLDPIVRASIQRQLAVEAAYHVALRLHKEGKALDDSEKEIVNRLWDELGACIGTPDANLRAAFEDALTEFVRTKGAGLFEGRESEIRAALAAKLS